MVETNKDIRTKHTVLAVLSQRTLPTLGADLKVAGLLKTRYVPAYQVTEAAREKLLADIPDSSSADQLVERDRRWRVEVLNATQDIADVPDTLKLTEADLPTPVLDKEGHETERSAANRQGVADLVVALGTLFVETPTA